MSNVLVIIFNILLVGTAVATVGMLVVRLLRRFLLDGLPPVETDDYVEKKVS